MGESEGFPTEIVPLSVEQARILVEHVRGHRLEAFLAMAIVMRFRRV
jgi:hypothetical protein